MLIFSKEFARRRERKALPCMGFIGTACAAPKGMVFSVVLVTNRVSVLVILTILVVKRAWDVCRFWTNNSVLKNQDN